MRAWHVARRTGRQTARPSSIAPAGRRQATSLPQIPGVILTNKEIPDDLLVSRVRKWADGSDSLRRGPFDLLQLAESQDGRLVPRAICGVLRTKLQLAGGGEPVPSLVTVFYRARDYLNKEFWEDQVRRLSDILADQLLSGGRGVQLTVHHNAPAWALGLELGDHRLLAEVEAFHVLGNPWRGWRGSAVEPEPVQDFDGLGADVLEVTGHASFHTLLPPVSQDAGSAASPSESAHRGHYVLRDGAGVPVCGLQVLGTLSSRLVCGAAWAAPGHEDRFGALLDALRRRAGKPWCSVLADPRDAAWQRLCGPTAEPVPGIWRSRRRMGVAITGTPVGLSPEEQARLATAPFLIPWEFVPFHFGKLVVI